MCMSNLFIVIGKYFTKIEDPGEHLSLISNNTLDTGHIATLVTITLVTCPAQPNFLWCHNLSNVKQRLTQLLLEDWSYGFMSWYGPSHFQFSISNYEGFKMNNELNLQVFRKLIGFDICLSGGHNNW